MKETNCEVNLERIPRLRCYAVSCVGWDPIWLKEFRTTPLVENSQAEMVRDRPLGLQAFMILAYVTV